MSTILITGAAGFIGSHLSERLLARADRVAGLDCFNDYYDPAIKRANLTASHSHPEFSLHETDICHREALFEVFRTVRPDVVVHLAARAGVRPSLLDPQLYHEVNVKGSQNLLDACREYPVQNLVFASSSSVYGGSDRVPFREDDPVHGPVSMYAATKRMNELQAHVHSHLYGLNVSMMRFFTVYGPRQRPDMAINKFTRMIAAGQPIPMFGDGTTRRDYTYIDDIVDGLVRTIDRPRPYEVYNLGESDTTELRELIQLLGELLGVEPVIDHQPLQPGDVPLTYADISKARELLGYDPQVPIREGLRRYVEWFKAQG
ncbi:MAG: NAD-dependent epimerase/dehydratase family protein [Candidatus Hydrogenedens sp.]|nr:NAD-dependent epimerase/dehydratase family protein [Candidatus Hydrogenedens sp.]